VNKMQQIQRLKQLESYLARTAPVEINVLMSAKNTSP